ncbi:MAG: glycosyltransferase family 2 protein [Vulcanimicrobiaceae bacterium]
MLEKISVVVPAYNEEDCVDELALRLAAVASSLAASYRFEFIIVENGSHDRTIDKLAAIHARDQRFKILRLSRNFGMEGAVIAGMRYATGDALVIMCADLQDPPELIPDFIAKWKAGFENVYGVISRRTDESVVRKSLTRGFYFILNRLVTHPVPENVSDFRLVDKRMYETMNRLDEKNRMLRALWGWIGFRSIGVEYVRPPRFGGKSTYKLWRNIGFALHALASSSIVPLKVIPLAGVAFSALSFGLLGVLAVRWVAYGVPFQGFGTIVALLLLCFGLSFLFLGIISEYVGIIFEEVRSRPHFVLESTLGFEDGAHRRRGDEFDEPTWQLKERRAGTDG